MQYNKAITSSLIKDEFPFVYNIYTILSDDSDFDAIVRSKGGRIVYPSRWTDPISAYDSMKQYGDFHPDVESPLKTICYNEETTEQFVLSPPKTTPQFLMPTTSVGISVMHRVLSPAIVNSSKERIPSLPTAMTFLNILLL